MQIKLGAQKELRSLRVGDAFVPSSKPEIDGGYLRLRDHVDPRRIVSIEAWACPICGASFLWARLVVENNHIASVEQIGLTESSLAQADLISAEVLMLLPMERTTEIRQLAPAELRRALALPGM